MNIPILAGIGFLFLLLGSASSDAAFSGLCLTGQGCMAIAQTPLSAILGLKLWWWGAIWLSAVVMMDLWRNDWPWLNLPLKAAAVIGFIGSLALPAAVFSMTGAFCTWCLATNLVFLVISMAVLLPKTEKAEEQKAQEWPSYLVMFSGLALMLSVPFWPRTSPCFELNQRDLAHLKTAVGGDLMADIIFVFTDPACSHCHATIPTYVKKAKEAGRTVVALWTPVIPASQSGEVAIYGSIAHWQGFGDTFMMKEHGPNNIASTVAVAKAEFTADEAILIKARGLVASNLRLFQELKLKGTPSFAQVRDGKLCVDLDARKLLP